MNSYSVRQAEDRDVPLLAEIEKSASKLFADTPYHDELPQETLTPQLLRECSDGRRLWVAVGDTDDIPVGFAAVLIVDREAHLHEMSVDPEHGRKGLGSKLMEAVIDWARDAGFQQLTLSTFRDVTWNMPWYMRRFGFDEIDHASIGSGLLNIREAEKDAGFDIAKRVVLRLAL